MFIVIQKIQLKKSHEGAYRAYKVDPLSMTFNGKTTTRYYYSPDHDAGRFERPHREVYKISLRQSYRLDGKVKTRQCVLGTIGYYALAEDEPLYDYLVSGMDHANVTFGSCGDLFDRIEAKLASIKKAIQREYHKTEEYKATHEREQLLKRYRKAKEAFAKKYSVDGDEYDYCYDIFGHVMDQAHLDEIIRRAEAYRSYFNSYSGNYSYSGSRSQDYGSYPNSERGNYTEDEQQMLKRFYKKLAMTFHPDMNPGADTTKEMQLLNKLKEDWKI